MEMPIQEVVPSKSYIEAEPQVIHLGLTHELRKNKIVRLLPYVAESSKILENLTLPYGTSLTPGATTGGTPTPDTYGGKPSCSTGSATHWLSLLRRGRGFGLSIKTTIHTSHQIIQNSGKTSPCPVGHPSRQVLQRGEPQRQIPTEGNPPAVLAPQRTGSPY
ncbi:hypothetical protein [Brasilonema sennae]|nr:hypothetical protein [Brasilonema sennae]